MGCYLEIVNEYNCIEIKIELLNCYSKEENEYTCIGNVNDSIKNRNIDTLYKYIP